MVCATLHQHKFSTENENSPSGKAITPESNHIALEVSELKAQIRKLKQKL
jgi:hypothetical protein